MTPRYNQIGISIEEFHGILYYKDGCRLALHKLGKRLPKTRKELEDLTEWYFGRRLNLRLRMYGSSADYEVSELFDDYDDREFAASFSARVGYHFSNYDIHGAFWNTIVGRVSCGGTAGRSYGQVDNIGHRHAKRLQKISMS